MTETDAIRFCVNFVDDDKNIYRVNCHLYEVETLYFWIVVDLGTFNPSQRLKLLQVINDLNHDASMLLRFGVDMEDRIAVSFRGDAFVLSEKTFEKILSCIIGRARSVRKELEDAGVEVISKGESK